MSNPIFNTQAFPQQFSERGRRRFTMDQRGQVTEQPQQDDRPYAQQHGMPGQGGVAAPQAAPQDLEPMTYDDVIRKTLVSFLVVLLGAGVSVTVGATSPALLMVLVVVGLLGGLVLGLVNSFKKEPNPALILAYSACQGLLLGGISMLLEMQFPGIVLQAVLGTVIVFGSVLALFRSGKVRATPKLTKMFMVAGMAYFVFSLVNVGLMMFGGTDSMFGLRGEMPLLGLALGALGILLATYSLVMDFTNIQEGVDAGVAKRFGWAAAFGLTVSLVWLYIELLRIIAIVRSMAE
ncbi:Bax inhibitor-1/YccA family protein [Nesterenkonia halophila]|uniref:Bax inhibitor-1/YccA family protein n=1 Tax=Nesterenkonia halophila TaxID=302044 RepID=UPI0012920E5D|nr:Bax inhibitor-1/YccA family protein [Nesterenkonia halophila]